MSDTLIGATLSRTEAEIITLFRQQMGRLKCAPSGWVFEVDCNPDRMVATFMDKERLTLQRGKPAEVNGKVRNGHC